MFLVKIVSEQQNLVKKFQSAMKRYKQNTDRTFTKWKISTKWNAEEVRCASFLENFAYVLNG